jgi:hypothetical protein
MGHCYFVWDELDLAIESVCVLVLLVIVPSNTSHSVTCAPPSPFSHHHSKRAVLCVDMPYTIQKDSFVLRMDIVVILLRYNGPYGHLGLIGYPGLAHNCIVLAQGTPI